MNGKFKERAALQHALAEVSQAISERKALENGLETVFELLRRAVIEAAKFDLLDCDWCTDVQIEEAWLFLMEVRMRHRNRRKRIAECINVLKSSRRWSIAFRTSAAIHDAMEKLGKDVSLEFAEIAQDFRDGDAGSGGNPWAQAYGVQSNRDEILQASHASLPCRDPWGSAAKDAGYPPGPWDTNANLDPWASSPQTCKNPWSQSQAAAGPSGGGFASSCGTLRKPALPAQNPWAAEQPTAYGNRCIPDAEHIKNVQSKADAGNSLFAAAYAPCGKLGQKVQENPVVDEKQSIAGKLAQGTAVAMKKTSEGAQVTYQAAKATNEKHKITGKITTGVSTAWQTSKEFEQKHQIGARTAEMGRSGVKAAKESNQKHDVTGKVAKGFTVAASGVSKGFQQAKKAVSSTAPVGQTCQQTSPKQPGYNPFGAPQQQVSLHVANPVCQTVPKPAGYNPFVRQGESESKAAPIADLRGRFEQKSQTFQQGIAQNAANAAARKYTGGAVTTVPPGMSNAALGYAKRHPKEATQFAHSAAKFAAKA